MKCFLITIFLILFGVNMKAESFIAHLGDNKSSPTANIDQVSWISGHWVGEAMGGQTEEIWSSPKANSMMCVFRFSKGGKIQRRIYG